MVRVSIRVIKIKGNCPVFKKGDRISIKGAEVYVDHTDALCVHALPSLLHYATALREGVDPIKLGLSKEKGKAYIHCPDPREPYTPGGTVVFEISVDIS